LVSRLIAGKSVLCVPIDPIWARAVRFLRGPNQVWLRTNVRRRRIDIERANDSERVGADVVCAEHPMRSKLALDPKRPLLVVGIQQSIGIANQCAGWEEVVVVVRASGAQIKAAQRRNGSGWKCGERHICHAGGKARLSGRGRVVADAGWAGEDVVRLRVIDHLRIVNAEPSANRGGATSGDVVGEPDPGAKSARASVKVCNSYRSPRFSVRSGV